MQMTNEELAQTIEITDKRVQQCGTGQPRYEPLLQHLKALLAEQLKRATAAPVLAPAAPVNAAGVVKPPLRVPQPACDSH